MGFLVELGQAVSISPNPSPYTRIEKILPADLDRQLSFACEEGQAPLRWHRWDYEFRSSVPGPHRRTIALLNYFALAESPNRSTRNEENQHRFEKMNQYYFCKGGPLARAAECGPEVTGVRFRWSAQQQGPAKWVEVRQACLP